MKMTSSNRVRAALAACAVGITCLATTATPAGAEASIAQAVGCEGTTPQLTLNLSNTDPVALGINVVIDGDTVAPDVTVPAEGSESVTVTYPSAPVGAIIELQTTTDSLVLARAELIAPPDCEGPGPEIVQSVDCDGLEPTLTVTVNNPGTVALGINVVVAGEVVATDVTVPAEGSATVTTTFVYEDVIDGFIELQTTNDALVLASTPLVGPDCELPDVPEDPEAPQTPQVPNDVAPADAAQPVEAAPTFTG